MLFAIVTGAARRGYLSKLSGFILLSLKAEEAGNSRLKAL
jgi:hypothetical protein